MKIPNLLMNSYVIRGVIAILCVGGLAWIFIANDDERSAVMEQPKPLRQSEKVAIKRDYELDVVNLLDITDAKHQSNARAEWQKKLNGYEERRNAAEALSHFNIENESAMKLYTDFLHDWAMESPREVEKWMVEYEQRIDDEFQKLNMDTSTVDGHCAEMDVESRRTSAWNAIVLGLSKGDDVDTSVKVATNGPWNQDASWEECYDVLAMRWLSKRGLRAAHDGYSALPSSMMRYAIYQNLAQNLVNTPEAATFFWQSEVIEMGVDLLLDPSRDSQ